MQPTRVRSHVDPNWAIKDDHDQQGASAEPIRQQQQQGTNASTCQKDFMFVPASGRTDHRCDTPTLRTMRAHVMHNYLNKKDRPERDAAMVSKRIAREAESMRFRLTSNGLERKYPYRYGKARATEDRKESADADSSTRVGSMVTYQIEAEVGSHQVLALFSGSSSLNTSTSRNVQEEDVSMNHPLLAIGLGQLDPVGALPFEVDATDEALLDRFQHYERWPWCPISGQSIWGPFAMTDKLVFHATMYSWAMHFRSRFIGDAKQQAAIVKHKLAAISLINARISRPEFATSDETLAGVSAITNIELWFGNAVDAQRHMEGLHALVTLRGGLHTLSSGVQKLVQRLISWNDLTSSQLYGVPMRFPPSEVCDECWRLLNEPWLPGSPPGLAMGELRAAGIMPHEAVSALHIIRQLSHMETVNPVMAMTESERMIRLDALAYVERRLHVLIQTAELSVADGRNLDMWKAVSLTSAMYVAHWLRGNPLAYPQFTIWTHQLQETLLKLAPDLQDMYFAPSMMLWVRAVGAIVSEHLPLHDWFLDCLAETCMQWGLDWEGLRNTLMSFLWIGDRDESRCARLWQRVVPRVVRLYSQG